MAELLCWNCGASLNDIPRPISRHATCGQCFEVLRCCRMCRHFLPETRPYCDHDRAEPPVEKAIANFCDFYKPANRFQAKEADKAEKARSHLDALFGTDEAGQESQDDIPDDGQSGKNSDPDDPMNKLKSLFDD